MTSMEEHLVQRAIEGASPMLSFGKGAYWCQYKRPSGDSSCWRGDGAAEAVALAYQEFQGDKQDSTQAVVAYAVKQREATERSLDLETNERIIVAERRIAALEKLAEQLVDLVLPKPKWVGKEPGSIDDMIERRKGA